VIAPAAWTAKFTGWLAGLDIVDLVLRLTLLDLLLRPIGNWATRPIVLAFAASGLLFPRCLRHPALWIALTALTCIRVVIDWPMADNHAYLLSYWCLAVALSLIAKDTEKCLAFNGRLLIGLVFGFAVLWKWVLSPDFMDGTFFQVTMLLDPRFENWTALLAGLSGADLEAQQAALIRHIDAPQLPIQPGPALPAGFRGVADIATAWTAVIELAVCVAFWWWVPRGLGRARHALLLIFCASTYAVAPVDGFGWLLIAMGVAQCERDRVITRGAYLAVFALILLYRDVPIARLLQLAVG
jgi:hypothetical protein